MRSERAIVLIIAAVQFVNILDFMMVMPLGPDFAAALGIPTSQIGTIGGVYTAAAGVAGLLGGVTMDRFDRRLVLIVNMLGLVVATALGAFATGFGTLLAARIMAGFFGGPATAAALAAVADVVPEARRGRAMSVVMSAFSIASILGVPMGLEIAARFGWRVPFLSVAALGLVVTLAAAALLPPLRGHLDRPAITTPHGPLISNRSAQLSFLLATVIILSGFLVIPNLSTYIQYNIGYPRERLGLLYFMGGGLSFIGLRVFGKLVDRYGSFRVGSVASGLLIVLLYLWVVDYRPFFPLELLFPMFMVAMSCRNISYQTLISKVPAPDERARFMSLQSAIQHFASAGGAMLSAWILSETPDHALVGMSTVGWIAIGMALIVPVMMYQVAQRVEQRVVQHV